MQNTVVEFENVQLTVKTQKSIRVTLRTSTGWSIK